MHQYVTVSCAQPASLLCSALRMGKADIADEKDLPAYFHRPIELAANLEPAANL